MTQTAGERDQTWRSPWAAPQGPATDAAHGSGTDGAPTAPLPPHTSYPTPDAPPAGPAPAPGYGQGSFGGQPPVPPAPKGPRRGPGWLSLGAVGVGSAVLASLLTVGISNATDDGATAPQQTTASQQQQSTQQAPVTSSSNGSPDWGAVASAVEKSVVAVQVQTGSGGGEGSGVVLDTQGHILTNNHVVDGAQQIVVVLSDGRGYKATVVGTDPSTDIAVIELTDPPADLTPATLGDSSAVRVGDAVMAAGNPLGLSDTVTTGIVSAVDRPVSTSASESQQQNPFGQQQQAAEQVVTNAIQTDAAVNPGNSGGALVDAQGRVIGITSSIASLGASMGGQSGSIGLGFAIPINEVKDVAQQLMDSGTVQHAYIGVGLSEDSVTVDGAIRQAAVVAQVTSGTPGDKAGLRQGDAIIAIDGENVNGADSLVAQIRERRPDTGVTLTVVRDGKTVEVPVTLGTRPAS